MIRRLSYLDSMSDIANTKNQILVHTITFNIIQSKTFVSCSGNIIKVKKFYKLGAKS